MIDNTSKALIGIVLFFIGHSLFIYIEAYIKANSYPRETRCGYVSRIYKKPESRGEYDYFDMNIQGKVLSFSVTEHYMKTWVNSQAKHSKRISKILKINDEICITYSLKYRESSILYGGQKVPYIFYIEWDRR